VEAAAADARLPRLQAGAAILPALIAIVHGPCHGLGPGHHCRLVAAVADTAVVRHRTGRGPAPGVHLPEGVGVVVAVGDPAIALVEGGARVVVVTTVTTVGAGAEAASGAGDRG